MKRRISIPALVRALVALSAGQCLSVSVSLRVLLAAFVLLMVSTTARAQSYTEGFDNITTLTANGWFMKNNSAPVGSTGWFQGRTTTFSAQAGPASSYIAADYNNVGSTGTISNWLLTPVRTLRNGDTFSFYTRTVSPVQYPDRLQLWLSLNGSSTNVGSTAESLGDFTTLLLDINPTLTTTGYPINWTQYTVTVSGLSAPTSGRFGLNYYVHNGGPSGTKSDYIGIDSVSYSVAGPVVANNVTLSVLPGATATIGNDKLKVATANGDAVTYTLATPPTRGTLKLDGTALSANNTFTQADIDANKLTYTAGSTLGSDSFGFSASDGGKSVTGTFNINIIETPSLIVTTTSDNSTSTDSLTSLREAIAYANTNAGDDIITFSSLFNSAQTINLAGVLPDLNSTITITGPSVGVTVRRNTGGSYRIFNITAGNTVTVSQLTLTNGNTTGSGGAIFSDGTLTLTNCTLSGNIASSFGGAVYSRGGRTVALNNCKLISNQASSGGALCIDRLLTGSVTTVNNCTFSNNQATTDAGAILNDGSNGKNASLTVQNSTFNGNSANWGGAIYSTGRDGGVATFQLQNSTFSGNSAVEDGGAIFNDSRRTGSGSLAISNCTFNGNSANSAGGVFNITTNDGNAPVTLTNTLLKAGTGTNLENVLGTITSLGYNLCTDNGAGFLTGSGDQINVADPKLGSLDIANGGPTATHALLQDSPAINAGDPTFDGTGKTDQRGQARVQRGRLDIGAYESSFPLNTAPVVDTNTGLTLTVGTTATIGNDKIKVTDGDGDTITYTLTAAPTMGTLKLNTTDLAANGTFTQADIDANKLSYTAGNATGSDSFEFSANDGNGGSVTGTFNITINDPLQSNPYTVTTTDDHNDGACTVGDCTLREAVNAANADGLDSTINLAAGATYTFATNDPQNTYRDTALAYLVSDNAAGHDLTINGNGATIARSSAGGTQSLRFFVVNGGADISINNVTFSNGKNPYGGAIVNGNGPNAKLTLTGCTFSGNSTSTLGGAIFNQDSTLTITNCTFSGNSASGNGEGGALYNYGSGTVTINNSTLAFNSATNSGGAIYNVNTLTLNSSIVAQNSAPNSPDIYKAGGSVSGDYNLIESSDGWSFNTGGTHNIVGRNPRFADEGLADNGGPTKTIALKSNSPALDKGKDFSSTGKDQRGQTRPKEQANRTNASGGDGSDIGAYEEQSDLPVLINTAPEADDQNVSVFEDDSVTITLGATDGEDDALTFTITQAPANGTLLNADNSAIVGNQPATNQVKYTPNANYNGADSLKFKVNDGTVDSNEATVSITVDSVSDAPVAVADSYQVAQNGTLNVAAPGVLFNDTNVDNDTVTAELVRDVANGTLTLNANGSFTYQPDPGFVGQDTFTYNGTDGHLDGNVVTVTISVLALPRVTQITPAAGAPGTVITVNGSNFNIVNGISLGGVTVNNLTVIGNTRLTFQVPAGALIGPVVLQTAVGNSSSGLFTVAPRNASLGSTSGAVNDLLMVSGTNIGGALLKVTIGGATASIVTLSPDYSFVQVRIPANAVTGDVMVSNAGGSTKAGDFTMMPRVSGLSPSKGAAGTLVTINGRGLNGVSDVQFGGVSVGAGNFTVVSSTKITAIVPALALSGPVSVMTPQGAVQSAREFLAAPRVSSVSPSSAAIGTNVTITGANLSTASVSINGRAQQTLSRSATQLVFKVATRTTSGNLVVSNAAGSANAETFTVTP
jgi:CSLREA domain-containing protein